MGQGPGRYLRPGPFPGYRFGGQPNPNRFSGASAFNIER